MASISEVVNVSLVKGGKLVEPNNVNAVAIFTSSPPLSTKERYRLYKNVSSVESDFGATSMEAKYAQVAWAQSPNPNDAGGAIAFCYYRENEEFLEAQSGSLEGSPIDVDTVLTMLYKQSDWSMDIKVDDVVKELRDLDFRKCVTLFDVADVLEVAIEDATVHAAGTKLLIKSKTTGKSSKVSTAIKADDGEYVGFLLQLDADCGVVVSVGKEEETLINESKSEALSAVYEDYKFGGYCFMAHLKDSEINSLATWNQANNVLGYITVDGANKLDKEPSNPVWSLMLSGQTNTRVTHSKVSNRLMACGYMSRCHVVNFSAANSAQTMHLKELANVEAELYTDSEVASAKSVGIDVYTTIKNAPLLLTSGVNDYTDNRYNLISFQQDMQVALFNLLKSTGTKIGQTEQGVRQIESAAEKECSRYCNSAVFGAGEWTSPDFFGDRETFLNSIRTKGYYVLSQRLEDQTLAERQNRQAPVLQVAVKNVGAMHSIDCIINFNL